MANMKRVVEELIENYISGDIDQDEFDERLDIISAYRNDVCSGMDYYYSNLE